MNLIKPKKLKQGGTISIIAPCAEVDMDRVLSAKKYFEKNGYKVKLGSNIDKHFRDLAGCDKSRLEDLHSAFLDKTVDAIVCARGGYGAIRLINKIDYSIIRDNPKIFCGYSDVTALSAMFLKHAGLITFSAPMAQSDFAGDVDEFTEKMFFDALTKDEIVISPKIDAFYKDADAQGLLFGGNLTTLASVCGADFVPDQKFLLFVEELHEAVYKIDRCFTQLLNTPGFVQNLTGILLGDFLDVDNLQYLHSLFKELADKLNIPVIGYYPITHDTKKVSIPHGAYARLQKGVITVKDFTV